jgi:hypothetical protein
MAGEPASLIAPAIVAAVVAGLVTAFGWWVTYRNTVRLDRERRDERTRDFQTALLAEIRSNNRRFAGVDLDEHLQLMVQRMRGDATFAPFVPHFDGATVSANIVKDIHILEGDIIDVVVFYYKRLNNLAALTVDLRSDPFRSASPTRKIAMYEDYIAQVRLTEEARRNAVASL